MKQTTINVTTNESATCKYGATNQVYSSMPNTMVGSGSTTHSATLSGLTNTSYTYYVLCNDTAGNIMTSSVSRTFSVANAVTPSQNYTVFFFEPFESQTNFPLPNFAGQNWYDYSVRPVLTTSQAVPGSTSSLEWHWTQGAITPVGGATLMRRLFNSSDTVYLSYWAKHSSNWIGSNLDYHPHMFLFINDMDGNWIGSAFTRSTLYVEHTLGRLYVGAQDGANIDQSRINQNLIGVTENRSANGCNGNIEPGVSYSCYNNGLFWNGKMVTSTTEPFSDTPGSNYKGDWQFIETYFQMNTITNGVGNTDGIIQGWIDGELVYDRTDHFFRTGQYPNMSFNQFFIGPYIGAGSPVDQSMWIDNLTVANRRPSSGATLPAMQRPGDLNDDGRVDFNDVLIIIGQFRRAGVAITNTRADMNTDGTINIYDLILTTKFWGAQYS